MVKGISRRAIVVKSPDPKVFEEAIFVIREDYFYQDGTSFDIIIKEAQEVADKYMKNLTVNSNRILNRIPVPILAIFGATVTGILWIILKLIGG